MEHGNVLAAQRGTLHSFATVFGLLETAVIAPLRRVGHDAALGETGRGIQWVGSLAIRP